MIFRPLRDMRWRESNSAPPAPAAEESEDTAKQSDPSDESDLEFRTIEPLNVRAAQVDPEQPWPAGVILPSALSVDFGDAANGLVAIRAGSLRGNAHLELGQPRQDSYAVLVESDFIHVAVADGVGSQQLSHIGATLAARKAVEVSRLGAGPAEIAEAVVQSIHAKAATSGIDPIKLSTTLCWARISIGEEASAWRVEVAEWGDSELLVYDSRSLRAGHPRWQRLRKSDSTAANFVTALPAHQVVQAQDDSASWHPGEVLGLYSDGIAADIRYDSVLGHALAKVWHNIPSPWDYVGQLAFRYGPANDDRTAVTMWRRDGVGEAIMEDAPHPSDSTIDFTVRDFDESPQPPEGGTASDSASEGERIEHAGSSEVG